MFYVKFDFYFFNFYFFNFDWLEILIRNFYKLTFYEVTQLHDMGHGFWKLIWFDCNYFF